LQAIYFALGLAIFVLACSLWVTEYRSHHFPTRCQSRQARCSHQASHLASSVLATQFFQSLTACILTYSSSNVVGNQ
jgi:hypothetical protein